MKNGAKRRRRVAIIYGGTGGEREVSILGAKNLLNCIDREKYIPLPVEIADTGEWFLTKNGEQTTLIHPISIRGRRGFTDGERFIPCSLAFPLLHGEMGEDGRVQGLLDTLGFNYVGCGVFAGAVAYDKTCTKIMAERLGIPTVRWIATDSSEVADTARKLAEENIGYPMFLKPVGQGSSIGAGAVFCRDDFRERFEEAKLRGDGRVLIEELVEDKRELECAYLSVPGCELVTPPGEVICRGFYGYGEKYLGEGGVKTSPRASVSDAILNATREYSLTLARAIGLRHLSRFDYFLSGGKLYLNEINTMPGFTNDSLYPAMLEMAGIDTKDLISLLIEAAANDRHP